MGLLKGLFDDVIDVVAMPVKAVGAAFDFITEDDGSYPAVEKIEEIKERIKGES